MGFSTVSRTSKNTAVGDSNGSTYRKTFNGDMSHHTYQLTTGGDYSYTNIHTPVSGYHITTEYKNGTAMGAYTDKKIIEPLSGQFISWCEHEPPYDRWG